ncbi:hypothetical protein PSACC_01288 [Paramicrosporidium saccamoebae]|uniref:Sorting nexin MVP1 n=1 Tax=Paramicrosporidium saccamoebae TaxID=1246581 RepID=A0A2H9TM77_9FUNG|nr:hypothetical protein PSACC_01288 [Paramicrosporidium saccamoebae]
MSHTPRPSLSHTATTDGSIEITESLQEILTLTDDEEPQVLAVKKPALKVTKRPPKQPPRRRRANLVDLTVDSPVRPSTDFVQQLPTPEAKKTCIKCSVCLDNMSHPTSTICGHLFCEACIILALIAECIANVDWLEQLDLRRAFTRLQNAPEQQVPWKVSSASLLQVVLSGADSQPIRPLDPQHVSSTLKLHAGPIPGVIATPTAESINPETKKRAQSEDKSRSASPSSDHSGTASPSSGTKKSRTQSIVRTTYYSALIETLGGAFGDEICWPLYPFSTVVADPAGMEPVCSCGDPASIPNYHTERKNYVIPIPVILTKPTTLTQTRVRTLIRTVTRSMPNSPPTQIISRFRKVMSDLNPTCTVTDCGCPYSIDNPNGDILPAHVCCKALIMPLIVATAYSKAIFVVREKTDLGGTLKSSQFAEMLAEVSMDSEMSDVVNFTEGELKVDDLLARLELMRATAEEGDDNVDSQEASDHHIVVANASYTSGESALDPWKRTVSQLSMGSILEVECSTCRVEVVPADMAGPFYDRHRNYSISTSTRNGEPVPPLSWADYLVTQSDAFVASRRRGLEEFLFLVVNHPVIQRDPILVEFLSVEDFSTIRNRVNPGWQEEFVCMRTSSTNEPVPIREPNWMIYDDAWKWSHHLKDAVEDLRRSLSSFAESHGNSHQQIAIISERMAKILENTQHVDHADLAVPKALEGLVTPHIALEMVTRTKRMKFDRFAALSDQIVSSQAHAEKLRARDGPNPTPDLEKALSRQDLLFQCKRNEFADECLRQELGWVVKMTKGIPALFAEIHKNLHRHYEILADCSQM